MFKLARLAFAAAFVAALPFPAVNAQVRELKIVVPAAHDMRARELWQELQKLHTEDPRAELWSKV